MVLVLVGVLIGGVLGFFAATLCQAAKAADAVRVIEVAPREEEPVR